jgi:hypothetical protein
MGGLYKLLLRDGEHHEAADERILGGGDFVESVLGNCEPVKECVWGWGTLVTYVTC